MNVACNRSHQRRWRRAAYLPILIGAIGTGAFVGAARSSGSQQPVQPVPPSTRVENCTTSGCHAEQLKSKFLHAPVAAGACEMCHTYADAGKHTFTLKHEGAEMCNFCHIGKTDTGGLHLHDPVQKGQCTACHNPHGSDIRGLIKGQTTGAMCLTCHESVVKDRSHIHTPIAQGDCLGCHKPHSSVFPGLLVEQGRALCLRCHAKVDQEAAAELAVALPHLPATRPDVASGARANADPSSQVIIHPPFRGECTQCHDQHGSNTASMLKQDAAALCISCHSSVGQEADSAQVHHSAVTSDKGCLNCHSPHTSHVASLLKAPQLTLCLDCHNKEIKKSDGTMVHSVADMALAGQHLHGPINDGSCAACHNVHGSEHRALLTGSYSPPFYQSFDAKAYALCLGCHKQELATAKVTTTATNFRNGDQNLHYLHVTAPGETGRSCRVCHATHSASNTRQVRDSVPYGEWDVPISFLATQTGGSCGPGCHRAREYDREKPVRIEPPTSSVPSSAR